MSAAFPGFEVRTLDVPRASDAGVELLCVTLDFGARLQAQAFAVLSGDERMSAARFMKYEDAMRYAVTRVVLRHALSERIGLPADELQFQRDANGRPRLASIKGKKRTLLDFNVSHSGQHVIIGLAVGRRIGVDIEARRPHLDCQTLAATVLAPREQARVASLPAHQRADAFYDAWTAKEALLKALGIGIRSGMIWFSVLGGTSDEPLIEVLDKRVHGAIAMTTLDAVWFPASEGYAACAAWSRGTLADC